MHLESDKRRISVWRTDSRHGTFRSWQIHTSGYSRRIQVSFAITKLYTRVQIAYNPLPDPEIQHSREKITSKLYVKRL
jgi:hypothetical protein